MELAQYALEFNRQFAATWNTLGVAYYRQGRFDKALEALHESIRLGGGSDPYDWLFVAMCHWRLGDETQAKEWLEKSDRWLSVHPDADEELRWFREEAGELMELAPSPSGA